MMYSRKHKNAAEPLMAVGESDGPYSNLYFFYNETVFSHSYTFNYHGVNLFKDKVGV